MCCKKAVKQHEIKTSLVEFIKYVVCSLIYPFMSDEQILLISGRLVNLIIIRQILIGIHLVMRLKSFLKRSVNIIIANTILRNLFERKWIKMLIKGETTHE